MKEVYVQLDQKTLRENARKIFIKPELTPEEKNELIKLKQELENVKKTIDSVNDLKETLEYFKLANKDILKELSQRLKVSS